MLPQMITRTVQCPQFQLPDYWEKTQCKLQQHTLPANDSGTEPDLPTELAPRRILWIMRACHGESMLCRAGGMLSITAWMGGHGLPFARRLRPGWGPRNLRSARSLTASLSSREQVAATLQCRPTARLILWGTPGC